MLAIQRADQLQFDPTELYAQAATFNRGRFLRGMTAVVEEVLAGRTSGQEAPGIADPPKTEALVPP
jgi:hypothetical protein